jgi:hypothetical protein
MERLTVISPAPWTDCLACAGGPALARKAAIWMRGRGDSCALFAGAELLAVAYLVPIDDGQLEFCLAVLPVARPHMLALCRFAHSTLTAAHENGAVVVCRVVEGNRAGERMARLTGFHRVSDTFWHFGEQDGKDREQPFRRGRQGREAAGGTEPPASAGGE